MFQKGVSLQAKVALINGLHTKDTVAPDPPLIPF